MILGKVFMKPVSARKEASVERDALARLQGADHLFGKGIVKL
jgi:hypothetical protein